MSENEQYPQDRSAQEQRYQEHSPPEYDPGQTQPYPQGYQQQPPQQYPDQYSGQNPGQYSGQNPGQYAAQYPYQSQQYPPPEPYTTVRDHPQAVLAFVLGLLSVLGLAILGPFGWYLGRKVVREIDAAPPGSYTNRGLGMAGMVLGIVGTVFLVLIAVAIVFAVIALVIAGTSASTSGGAGY